MINNEKKEMRYSILKFSNRHIMNMKTKKDIVEDWLPRYTGRALEDFSKHIILTNFDYYLDLFAEKYNAPIIGENKNMPNVSHDGITMINFGMGSANAATNFGLTFCHRTGSRVVHREMWGTESQTPRGGLHPSHCRHQRRGYIQRLHAERSPFPALFQRSESLFKNNYES